MQDNIRISYPSSEKVYLAGTLFPDLKVAMRRVNQKPTVTKDKEGNKHFKENAPVYIYMTPAAPTATRRPTST